MFVVHLDGVPDHVLACAADARDAMAAAQDLAEELAEQLRRNGEGHTGLWVTFTVADQDTGECISWISTGGNYQQPRR